MRFILLSFILLAVVGCTPHVFYSGERYPPYQPHEIEVFFDENKIDQPYEIMGTLANSDSWFANQARIEQAIIDRAKAVGADAVVFYDMDVEHSESELALILKAKAVRYHYPDN